MHKAVLNPGARDYIYQNPNVFYEGQTNAGAPIINNNRKISKKNYVKKLLRKLERARYESMFSNSTTGAYVAETPPFDVDVVFTWVQHTPALKQRKQYWLEKYKVPSDNEINRYVSSDELKFGIRSVYQYAPWVRRIFVVAADDQQPDYVGYMSTESKIPVTIVPHSLIYDNECKQHLPTFNSQSIETHLHQIPGLAERFFYFNDDQFFANYTQWSDFFTNEGHPKIVFGGLAASGRKYPNMSKNAMGWINSNNLLDKVFPQHRKDVRRSHVHQGVPLLKSAFHKSWEHPIIKKQLLKTSASKFRMDTDLYFIGFLVYFSKYHNQSTSTELPTYYCQLYNNYAGYLEIFKSIIYEKPTLLCINDGITKGSRKTHRLLLQKFLEFLFPVPANSEM